MPFAIVCRFVSMRIRGPSGSHFAFVCPRPISFHDAVSMPSQGRAITVHPS